MATRKARWRWKRLWNELQKGHQFSLLCGYSMEQFGGEALAPVLVDACAEHSRVVPAESYSALDDYDARLRQVAALQQKAVSLEREVAERKRAEEQLQVALSAERVARDTAEAALRAREEFLSIASHELRTHRSPCSRRKHSSRYDAWSGQASSSQSG